MKSSKKIVTFLCIFEREYILFEHLVAQGVNLNLKF